MKWVKRNPVKAGEIVRLTVLGVSGDYRAKVDAASPMCLTVDDLELVAVSALGGKR